MMDRVLGLVSMVVGLALVFLVSGDDLVLFARLLGFFTLGVLAGFSIGTSLHAPLRELPDPDLIEEAYKLGWNNGIRSARRERGDGERVAVKTTRERKGLDA